MLENKESSDPLVETLYTKVGDWVLSKRIADKKLTKCIRFYFCQCILDSGIEMPVLVKLLQCKKKILKSVNIKLKTKCPLLSSLGRYSSCNFFGSSFNSGETEINFNKNVIETSLI